MEKNYHWALWLFAFPVTMALRSIDNVRSDKRLRGHVSSYVIAFIFWFLSSVLWLGAVMEIWRLATGRALF